jgi:hypothetical protein
VYGTGLRLPSFVGHAHALDVLMSARRVQSDEALRIGLAKGGIRPSNCASRPMPTRAIFAKAWRVLWPPRFTGK